MIYTCSMHPEVQQNHPGRCPKCGMKLITEEEAASKKMEMSGEEQQNSYRPLIIIIALISLVTLVLGLRDWQLGVFTWQNAMSNFMAGFFLVFSGFKLMDVKGFAEGYSTYDLLAKRVFTYGYSYPFIELTLGLLYLLRIAPVPVNIVTFIVMTFSGIGVAIKVARKEKFQCACLGTFLKVPLTKVTLIEDFGMAAMALFTHLLNTGANEKTNPLIFQLHSPETFRFYSTIGHWIAGYVMLIVAVIALVQALGYAKSRMYLWPGFLVIAGAILIPYYFLHPGLAKLGLVLKVIWVDHQEQEHLLMFVLLFVGGLVELLYSLKKIKEKIWPFVFPSVIIIIGLLFLFHQQQGTLDAIAASLLYHRTLGTFLVITGTLKAAAIINDKQRIFAIAWAIFLALSAILLIVYNEPAGSYTLPT